MSNIDDGGTAFPYVLNLINGHEISYGLTRRDWFATFAPEPSQGLILKALERERRIQTDRRSMDEIIADLKYEYADRMIAASKRSHDVG